MKTFNRIFFRGLITLLPVAITIYIVYSAVVILESLLGGLLRELLPEYIPGLGVVFVFVLIFVFGLLLNNLIAAKLISMLEKRLTRIPFINAIYSPLRDLMNLFSQTDSGKLKHVVLVELIQGKAKLLGVVTRESFNDLHIDANFNHQIAVYFPMSYGLGGYTMIVPKSSVQEIDIPIEKAMSLAITGWVKVDSKLMEMHKKKV